LNKLEIKIKFVTGDVAYADESWHEAGQIDRKTGDSGTDRWGRTTYLFTRENGVWSEVMERVANLRLPYFNHYQTMPEPVAVAPQILASYAGVYEAGEHKLHTEIKAGWKQAASHRRGLRTIRRHCDLRNGIPHDEFQRSLRVL